jgi:ATP/maltotriose-dependent transcriptional regulator MalT
VATDAQQALERAGGALLSDVSIKCAQLVNLYLDGEWQQAVDAAGAWRLPGNYVLRRQTTWSLAPIALFRGDFAGAWQLVTQILRGGTETEPGDAVYPDALMLQVLAANLSLAVGDLAGARTWMAANDRWLVWGGSVSGRAANSLGWAEVEHAAGNLALARTWVEKAVLAATEPRQPLVSLAALRERGAIRRDQGDLTGAERDLLDSLELATACEIPFERARSMVELVILHAGTGDARVPGWAGEAQAIGEAVGAQPLLARLAALMLPRSPDKRDPFGLTARELDVLRLAAQGLTDIEIGERLSISSRTVSQHLHSVYGKCQVRTRVAATRIAIEHHLL